MICARFCFRRQSENLKLKISALEVIHYLQQNSTTKARRGFQEEFMTVNTRQRIRKLIKFQVIMVENWFHFVLEDICLTLVSLFGIIGNITAGMFNFKSVIINLKFECSNYLCCKPSKVFFFPKSF